MNYACPEADNRLLLGWHITHPGVSREQDPAPIRNKFKNLVILCGLFEVVIVSFDNQTSLDQNARETLAKVPVRQENGQAALAKPTSKTSASVTRSRGRS